MFRVTSKVEKLRSYSSYPLDSRTLDPSAVVNATSTILEGFSPNDFIP